MSTTTHTNLELIHQYVYEVVDFSSQYGSENGTSYSAANLVGPCQVYPNYCDSSATCSFRTFGTWWRDCPSALKPIRSPSPPHSRNGHASEDYVDLFFDIPVIPVRLQIFETYNPGAIVRVSACYRTQAVDVPMDPRKLEWVTLWQAPPPFTPCFPSRTPRPLPLLGPEQPGSSNDLAVSCNNMSRRLSNASCLSQGGSMDSEFHEDLDSGDCGHRQRACVFQPPLTNVPLAPTDLIRIEFDSTRCPYYTEIDAIRLTGWAEVLKRSPVKPQLNRVIPTLPSSTYEGPHPADQSLAFFSDLLRPQSPHLDQISSQSQPMSTSSPDVSSTSACSSPELESPHQLSLHLSSNPAAAPTSLCRLSSLGMDFLLPRLNAQPCSVALGAICPVSLFGLIRLSETALWRHGPITRLPYEVLLRIFSYLDLQSICRAARVSRQFRCLADDALAQLHSLNLQPYWHKLTDTHLLTLGRRLGRVNLTARAAAVATTGNSVIPYTLLRRLEEESTGQSHSRVRRRVLAARVRSWSASASADGLSPVVGSPEGTRDLPDPLAEVLGAEDTEESAPVDLLKAYALAFPLCRLRRLDMSWCGNYSQINPEAFGDFLGDACHCLTTLRLASCKFLNDDCVLHIANACRLLEELDLSSCTGISAHGFFLLGRLIYLRWISLYRTRITDEGVINIFEQCQHLQHLNLGSCIGIQDMDSVLEHLMQRHVGLVSLNLWRCVTVTATGIGHIFRSSSSTTLEDLDLGWCRNILVTQNETNCMVQLVQRCRRLRRLILTGTRLLNSEDLITIGQTLNNQLEQLDIHGSENINIAAVAILLTQCPQLRFLDLSFCHQILWYHVVHLRRLFPTCTIVSALRDFEVDQLGNPIHRVLIEELVDEFMDRLQLAFGLATPRALPPGQNVLALPAPYSYPAITGPDS